jgi:hypothetical protein
MDNVRIWHGAARFKNSKIYNERQATFQIHDIAVG